MTAFADGSKARRDHPICSSTKESDLSTARSVARHDSRNVRPCGPGASIQSGFSVLNCAVPRWKTTRARKANILEAPSQDSDFVRISPDPIAEHLVARLRTEELGGNAKAWRAFLAQVRRVGSPEGFVAALVACIEDAVYGSKVPTPIVQQIKALRDSAEGERTAA